MREIERFLFFNSTAGDKRSYQAQDFAEYFGSVLSSGLIHTDNVPGMQVTVQNGTLNTIVSAGKAIMKGHLYENTTPLTLVHRLPEPTTDRIDRIVLRLDLRHNERYIRLFVKDGTPSFNPVPPTLQRDDMIYEISLAQIRVRANTVQLRQEDLIDERLDQGVCGLVNSMLTVPTSQFQEQWDLYFNAKKDEINSESASILQQMADDLVRFNNDWNAWFSHQQTEGFVMQDEKESPNGIATLGDDGKVPLDQLPPTDLFAILNYTNDNLVDLVNDTDLMQHVANSELTLERIMESDVLTNAIINSQVAMSVMIESTSTMNILTSNPDIARRMLSNTTSKTVLETSSMATAKAIAGAVSLSPNNYSNFTNLATSKQVMDKIVADTLTLDYVFSSSLCKDIMFGKDQTTSAIAGNETAIMWLINNKSVSKTISFSLYNSGYYTETLHSGKALLLRSYEPSWGDYTNIRHRERVGGVGDTEYRNSIVLSEGGAINVMFCQPLIMEATGNRTSRQHTAEYIPF